MKQRSETRDYQRDYNEFNRIKSIGFSDKKLSELTKTSEDVVRQKKNCS